MLLVLLSTAGYAAAATAKDVHPFAYTFRITSVTVTATFTHGASKVSTNLHLEAPPKQHTLTWLGPENSNAYPSGSVGTLVTLAGEAVYTSPDSTCAKTLKIHWHPIPVGFSTSGGPIYVSVTKFPLAIAIPGPDSGTPFNPEVGRCGKPKVHWFDNANGFLPLSVLRRPGFTASDHRKQRLEDQESIDWTLQVKVQRIRYKALSCAKLPTC